jgi:hypothetical protein
MILHRKNFDIKYRYVKSIFISHHGRVTTHLTSNTSTRRRSSLATCSLCLPPRSSIACILLPYFSRASERVHQWFNFSGPAHISFNTSKRSSRIHKYLEKVGFFIICILFVLFAYFKISGDPVALTL